MKLNLTINGHGVCWTIDPGELLIDVLRREGFSSVKLGCGEGDCGSCSVLVDGKLYRACLMFAGQVEGRQLDTVEGMGNSEKLHPLQVEFITAGAVQCGYCTPGMLLAARSLLDENNIPNEQDVREALDGNLCRCTGYKKIISAVMKVAEGGGK